MYKAFPWMYKYGMISSIYMALGGLYWRYEAKVNMILKPLCLILLLVVYLLITILRPLEIQCTTSMCQINMVGVCIALVGSLLLISLCKFIPSNKALQYIGNNSIGFYFLCGGVPNVLCGIAKMIMPCSDIYVMILLTIISVGISFVVVYILLKCLPWLFDLRVLKNRN